MYSSWGQSLVQGSVARVVIKRFWHHSDHLISCSFENGVRRIVLNSPKTRHVHPVLFWFLCFACVLHISNMKKICSRNSLSLEMMKAIQGSLIRDSSNAELRAIVISSEGPVFSSGHNLKELTEKEGREYHQKVFSLCTEMMTAIPKLPVPVIAKVRGLAAAAGCQLVASCDLVIAGDKASFSTPGANFGLFCSTPGIAVTRSMSHKMAAYMLFTGRPITAQEAHVAGLVSRVVPDEKLGKSIPGNYEELEKMLEDIRNKSRAVIEMGKSFYHQQKELPMEHAYRIGEQVMVENLALKDGQEGMKAFAEKRKPVW
ncbi:unnamed protein product, partial [Darwinula stevensoni]